MARKPLLSRRAVDAQVKKFVKSFAADVREAKRVYDRAWELLGDQVVWDQAAVTAALEQAARKSLTDLIRTVFVDGAKDALTEAASMVNATLTAPYDPDLPAARYFEERAPSISSGLGESADATVRRTIAEGIRMTEHPRVVARKIRESIGLHPRWARAVQRTYDERIAAGDDEDQAIDAMRKHADKLIRRRAENIARTEAIRANNAARLEGWQEAGMRKYTEGMVKRWVASFDEKLCPICKGLDGQERPVGVPFDSDLVGAVMHPPSHPNCRCTMILARAGARGRVPEQRIPEAMLPFETRPNLANISAMEILSTSTPAELLAAAEQIEMAVAWRKELGAEKYHIDDWEAAVAPVRNWLASLGFVEKRRLTGISVAFFGRYANNELGGSVDWDGYMLLSETPLEDVPAFYRKLAEWIPGDSTPNVPRGFSTIVHEMIHMNNVAGEGAYRDSPDVRMWEEALTETMSIHLKQVGGLSMHKLTPKRMMEYETDFPWRYTWGTYKENRHYVLEQLMDMTGLEQEDANDMMLGVTTELLAGKEGPFGSEDRYFRHLSEVIDEEWRRKRLSVRGLKENPGWRPIFDNLLLGFPIEKRLLSVAALALTKPPFEVLRMEAKAAGLSSDDLHQLIRIATLAP